jgi:TIR domain-containing protein
MSNAERRWEPLTRPPAVPPQAFLSYALESDSHQKWVFDLATKLRENGVRTILDLWDLPVGSDQFYFMERSIEKSDFVIVICTPTYAQKANSREGGVGFETRVITGEFAKKIEFRKFIPVLRSGEWDSSAPNYLKSIHGVDLRNEPYSQIQFEKLVRTLHCEPLQPPPVGPKPAFSSTRIPIPPAASQTVEPPKRATDHPQPNCITWSNGDPGPCIDVVITNSQEVIEAGRAIGLEYPEPVRMRALLDSGAALTVVSKTFAKYCKLLQTGETEIRALGSVQRCGEHAGAIGFPGTNLRSYDPIRLISADFVQERHFAVLIGRDILRNWTLTFDGRHNRVTITD